MAKQIARLLKADIQESSDLKSIARMLSKKGRGGDTMLAHITPKEAAILKEAGGAGTVNPDTGLLEFYDWSGGLDVGGEYQSAAPSTRSSSGYDWSGFVPESVDVPATSPIDYSALPSFPVGPSASAPAAVEMPPIDYQQYAEIPPTPAQAAQPFSLTYQGTPPAPIDPGLAAKAKSFTKEYIGEPLKDFREATGISGADLARIGIAGVGAYKGRQMAQQAAKQNQQAVQEQKQIGKPYQEKGQELQRAALAGELTPQSAQAYQALRAQMAQGIESRGGVGVAQAQAQLEAFRQNLLQNQYNFGLQVSQIGDNMALGAIRTGMQLDQQLAAANQQFYTQLAAIAGGGTYGYKAPGGQ